MESGKGNRSWVQLEKLSTHLQGFFGQVFDLAVNMPMSYFVQYLVLVSDSSFW